jgi:hypothetical protein
MTGRSRVIPALLGAALLLPAACSSSTKSGGTDAGDIKVMVIAGFTLAAAPAKANYDAVRIQADRQNAEGGINGHQIKVIGCDDQSDPNVGAKCAQQAVREHVAALLGQFTQVGDSIWPIINAAGIPSIGLVQYGASDQTSPNAWPLPAPAVIGEAAATGYLAKDKGCTAIADVQANSGPNTRVPVALNKKVLSTGAAKYVGPFLLPFTSGLANAPAIAKSITNKADCANIADGENGIILMKAILQLDPSFKFATTQVALPADWPHQMGSEASAVNAVGGLAPDTSSVPGVVAYLKAMKAKASGDTLNEFSKLAWASFYAFAQVASTIKGDVTAKTLTQALGHASSVDTQGIAAPVDFTKATPLSGITRMFTTKVFVLGAQNGQPVQVAEVDATKYLPN